MTHADPYPHGVFLPAAASFITPLNPSLTPCCPPFLLPCVADKFWYCRLSPNHKVLHYGDLEESPQGEVPHDSLQDKRERNISSLLLFKCTFPVEVVHLNMNFLLNKCKKITRARLKFLTAWINQRPIWADTVFRGLFLLSLSHVCPLCSACSWYQSCYHGQRLSSHEGEGSPQAKQGVFQCVHVRVRGRVCVQAREHGFVCKSCIMWCRLHNFCSGKYHNNSHLSALQRQMCLLKDFCLNKLLRSCS